MNANICNFLRVFHTFLYKIGGHVYRYFVVKPRAYCRLVTGIVGDELLFLARALGVRRVVTKQHELRGRLSDNGRERP